MQAPGGRLGPWIEGGKLVALLLWVAIAGALVWGMAAAAFGLVVAAWGLIHEDALATHLFSWVSWPLMLGLDGFLIGFAVHEVRERRRKWRERPGKLRGRSLVCPICKEPLPAWGGTFETCPVPHFGRLPRNKDEVDFRIPCARCGRDAWFTADLDGAVRPQLSWMIHVLHGPFE